MGRLTFTAILLFSILAAGPPLFGQARLEWVRRYDSPSRGSEQAWAIILDGDGNIYMTGATGRSGINPGNEDAITAKISSGGRRLWTARFDGPGQSRDAPSLIALDPAGGVIVADNIFMPSETYDTAVIKYDGQGNPLWAKVSNEGDGASATVTSIAVDPQGIIWVAGLNKRSGSLSNHQILKYDAEGNLLWLTEHSAGDQEYIGAGWSRIILDPTGGIAMAGSYYPGRFRDETYTAILSFPGSRAATLPRCRRCR